MYWYKQKYERQGTLRNWFHISLRGTLQGKDETIEFFEGMEMI
jgi:hypothetical protein